MRQLLSSLLSSLRDLAPIILVVAFFQLAVVREPIPNLFDLLAGFVLVVIGLTLFVRGLDMGLFPLGESMAWFERELQWGVPPTELRHLIGRIGELYAALITNGQMALDVNQQGYDIVSDLGERISVKTTAISGTAGHISFNRSTLDQDRCYFGRTSPLRRRKPRSFEIQYNNGIRRLHLV